MKKTKKDAATPSRLDTEYAAVLRFAVENCGLMNYTQFDLATIQKVNLFAMREELDIRTLEKTLDKIIAALPAIKRIFARPIIRLKDKTELLPVESVHVINNRTLAYASVHSETWGNITPGEGMRPKKLLTLRHEDSYVTYENIGFAKAITVIFRFIAHAMQQMTDTMFAARDMRFNLLERQNHLAYFLAIGKLHVGYIHNCDRLRVASERCAEKMLFIDRVLSTRRSSPVYKSCKGRIDRFVLKKSTTFRVHKDYAQIYKLLKWFAEHRLDVIEEPEEEEENTPGYTAYCHLITLFAAGHFSFEFAERPIDFMHMHARARFRDYRLLLRTVTVGKKKAIMISVQKEKLYRILLLPGGTPADLESFRSRCHAEEFLIASPSDEQGSVYLSLFDIESFRRVQQLLLRAMVYADEKRDICPFCGEHLVAETDLKTRSPRYTCPVCRTVITEAVCPAEGKTYFETAINGYFPTPVSLSTGGKRERMLYRREVESLLFLRNITPSAPDGTPLCPHCQKIHTQEKTDP